MPEPKAKLTFRVGDQEVQFEAGLEAVKAELDRLAAARMRGAGGGHAETATVSFTAPRPASGARDAASKAEPPPTAPAKATSAKELRRHVTFERKDLDRVFAIDTEGLVSVRTLPEPRRKRLGDLLMLLLYGMLALQGRSPVPGSALLDGAHRSGITLIRADRYLARKGPLVVSGGQRRGKRYRLTAEGIPHCEKLVRELLGGLESTR